MRWYDEHEFSLGRCWLEIVQKIRNRGTNDICFEMLCVLKIFSNNYVEFWFSKNVHWRKGILCIAFCNTRAELDFESPVFEEFTGGGETSTRLDRLNLDPWRRKSSNLLSARSNLLLLNWLTRLLRDVIDLRMFLLFVGDNDIRGVCKSLGELAARGDPL